VNHFLISSLRNFPVHNSWWWSSHFTTTYQCCHTFRNKLMHHSTNGWQVTSITVQPHSKRCMMRVHWIFVAHSSWQHWYPLLSAHQYHPHKSIYRLGLLSHHLFPKLALMSHLLNQTKKILLPPHPRMLLMIIIVMNATSTCDSCKHSGGGFSEPHPQIGNVLVGMEISLGSSYSGRFLWQLPFPCLQKKFLPGLKSRWWTNHWIPSHLSKNFLPHTLQSISYSSSTSSIHPKATAVISNQFQKPCQINAACIWNVTICIPVPLQ